MHHSTRCPNFLPGYAAVGLGKVAYGLEKGTEVLLRQAAN
jgi:hypothetical protein